MTYIGLDLGGLNSLACICDELGTYTFQGSTFPDRPSVVLLPLVRKERLVAADDALRNERGLGLPWPPLATAAPQGWSNTASPVNSGRVLLGDVWQRLNRDKSWNDDDWQPPDGLRALSKPSPYDCLDAEISAVVQRAMGQGGKQVVLSIPNALPEVAQEALLQRLRSGSRLIWRSMAIAMAWAEDHGAEINAATQLAIIDVDFHGVEISVCNFRRHEVDGRIFHAPVRRLTKLRLIETGNLLQDSPAPFLGIKPDLTRLQSRLGEIEQAIEGATNFVLCGPLASHAVSLFQLGLPRVPWPVPDTKEIARGAALFASRLVKKLPTYFDVLPSLDLFITNRRREPEWLSVIPSNFEIAGGQEYAQSFEHILALRAGTGELENWLRRSDESGLRKLTTKLAHVCKSEVPVDLKVVARSAGGLARLEVSPCDDRSEVFGANRRLLLNWLSMKRESATPSGFPAGTKFGWPDTGELLGCRTVFKNFLSCGLEYCATNDLRILTKMESFATKSTPVPTINRSSSGTVPVRSLPCFGSENPCRFYEGGLPNRSELECLDRINDKLWQELNRLKESRLIQDNLRTRLLVRILGRMGAHSPAAFAQYVSANLKPKPDANILFAAGRVFSYAEQAKVLFEKIRLKDELKQPLTAAWLKVLDYMLFQRSNILESTTRGDLTIAIKLSLRSLQGEVEKRKLKVTFELSVRAIARLLRARRHHPDFVSSVSEIAIERSLSLQIQKALDDCLKILPMERDLMGVSRNPRARLCELTRDWLLTTALTNVLGPPDQDDEEDDGDSES